MISTMFLCSRFIEEDINIHNPYSFLIIQPSGIFFILKGFMQKITYVESPCNEDEVVTFHLELLEVI